MDPLPSQARRGLVRQPAGAYHASMAGTTPIILRASCPRHRPGARGLPVGSTARGALAALALLSVLAGCGRDEAPPGMKEAPPAVTKARPAGRPEPPAAAAPTTGPAPAPTLPAASPPASPPVDGAWSGGARVALVVDDLGQRLGGADAALLDLPVPLTLAVLPGLPHSRAIAARAAAHAGRDDPGRRELYLHLPMQPEGYPQVDPGPDALLVGLAPGEVEARLDRALSSVPGAVGVNNHMGSAATADTLLMAALMAALEARGLRFLDSLTTPRSVAWRAARAVGVPCSRNRLFLDVEPHDESAISARLAELVAVARRSGQAIGIVHPHAASAAVLAREIPRYRDEGVHFVTVSELATAAAPLTAGPLTAEPLATGHLTTDPLTADPLTTDPVTSDPAATATGAVDGR